MKMGPPAIPGMPILSRVSSRVTSPLMSCRSLLSRLLRRSGGGTGGRRTKRRHLCRGDHRGGEEVRILNLQLIFIHLLLYDQLISVGLKLLDNLVFRLIESLLRAAIQLQNVVGGGQPDGFRYLTGLELAKNGGLQIGRQVRHPRGQGAHVAAVPRRTLVVRVGSGERRKLRASLYLLFQVGGLLLSFLLCAVDGARRGGRAGRIKGDHDPAQLGHVELILVSVVVLLWILRQLAVVGRR